MLRVRRRVRPLRSVFRALRDYRDRLGLDVKVCVLGDRPAPEVLEIVRANSDLVAWYGDFPEPVVSRRGLRFNESARHLLGAVRALNPTWVLFQDDDRWLEPLGAWLELPRLLADRRLDLLYAHSWFVWDDSSTYNKARTHYSPIFFRFRPGDQYPLDREIQAPLPLHDEAIVRGRTAALKTPLLDYGSFSPLNRLFLHRRLLQAGKDDPYTRALLAPPTLRSIGDDLGRPWLDYWHAL